MAVTSPAAAAAAAAGHSCYTSSAVISTSNQSITPPLRCLELCVVQAHVEHVSYSAFQAAVDNCVDPDCRRALKALADLFALRCIEQDVIFRNDEYVAPAKVSEE